MLVLQLNHSVIFTARKRSLRRLYFHRRVWFCKQGGVCVVLFRGACVVLFGGACMVLFWGWGGVHGFIGGHAWFYSRGACVVLFGGHAWFYLGGHAWFYSGGMCGFIRGGMRGFIQGACVVLFRGGAWFFQFFRIQWDTVNERAVRILLECILVS